MREGRKQEFAKRLRRTMTDAERRLWWRLRDRMSDGWKFRRQHPVGPYIVDFICLEAGLVIEVDGGQHLDSASDRARTQFLETKGYRVLRFWNNEALASTDTVLDAIFHALRERHSP